MAFLSKSKQRLCANQETRVTVVIVTHSTIGSYLRKLEFTNRIRYEESHYLTIIRTHVIIPVPMRLLINKQAFFKRIITGHVIDAIMKYAAVHGRPQLIHHHCLSDNAYLAQSISRLFQIPYIFTEHSNYFTYAELNRFNDFENFEDHRRFVKGAAERIAVSEIRARGYEEIFDAPFICIPNMVTNLFSSPLVKRSRDLPFTFICVALLDRRKRQDVLLRAFALAFKGQNIRLIIVGNGVLQDEYKKLSIELAIDGQVEFKGKRDRADVRGLFDESHVAVLSSDQETFGIALAEAMFRGIPVISTSSGGPEEVVTPETGLLTPKGNEAALAAAMKEIFDHYERYDAEKIRASAMRRYSEGRIVDILEQVYNRVCLPETA